MANDATKDEDRRELTRLLEGLECYRSWVIAAIERDKGTVTQDDLNQIVMPGASFLEVFDETGSRGRKMVIKDVRQWYSHAASDLQYMVHFGQDAWATEVTQFLKDFKGEVGFDFLAEAGLLRNVANKALKSHKIANEEDYYSLKELEDDLSQSVLSSDELAVISGYLRDFEDRMNAQATASAP